MTIDETVDVLTVAAAYDRRTIGQADAIAWHAAIGDLPFRDARQAVIDHYRESTDWLMPAHVRERVDAVRFGRLRQNPIPPPPPELLDNPQAYREYVRDKGTAIANNEPERKQIGDGR